MKAYTNIQLAFWKDAKDKYSALTSKVDVDKTPRVYWETNVVMTAATAVVSAPGGERFNVPDLGKMILVTAALIQSLLFLFGVNYYSNGFETPGLMDMVNTEPWKLKKQRPDLFRDLKSLFNFFQAVIKHPDANKLQAERISLDLKLLKKYMTTTKDIWGFFIQDYYDRHNNGIIPGGALDDFTNI